MLPQLINTAKGLVLLFLAARAFAWLLKPEDARWFNGRPTIVLLAMFAIGMLAYEAQKSPTIRALLCRPPLGVIAE